MSLSLCQNFYAIFRCDLSQVDLENTKHSGFWHANHCFPAEMRSPVTTFVTHILLRTDVVISSLRTFMCRRETPTAQWTWTAWTGTCPSVCGRPTRCYRWACTRVRVLRRWAVAVKTESRKTEQNESGWERESYCSQLGAVNRKIKSCVITCRFCCVSVHCVSALAHTVSALFFWLLNPLMLNVIASADPTHFWH